MTCAPYSAVMSGQTDALLDFCVWLEVTPSPVVRTACASIMAKPTPQVIVAALYAQSVASGKLTRRIANYITEDDTYASTFGEAIGRCA
jgi:hypothetical protein